MVSRKATPAAPEPDLILAPQAAGRVVQGDQCALTQRRGGQRQLQIHRRAFDV
jgi:hypothetical protein